MITTTVKFTLAEKLAIVQAVDSVILADGTVHKGEITALHKLMNRLDFDSNFILQARNVDPENGRLILRDMPNDKKEALATILEEMALADGFVHEKEAALISKIFSFVRIGPEFRAAK